MSVRFGSDRITASSTSSSTTTITRVEAKAASCCTPTRPQICVLPATSARGDHLIVDQVRGEAGEREIAPALADDLVARGETDEVREPLDDDRVAIVHEAGDRLPHRHDLRGVIRHPLSVVRKGGSGGGMVLLFTDDG